MNEIEKFIFRSLVIEKLITICNEQKINRLANEITIDSKDTDDSSEDYLVSEGFSDNSRELAFDSYLKKPYRIRMLIGLAEEKFHTGDDDVYLKPNKFRYGEYK